MNGSDDRPAGELAGELRDGKKHGVWVERTNGYLVERTYRDGVVHGSVREWHPDGHLAWRFSCIDGAKDGLVQELFPNGRVKSEWTVVAGKTHGFSRQYDESGVVRDEHEYRHGASWNGVLDSPTLRGRYESGQRVGLWELRFPDLRIEERGAYVDGKRHGVFELGDDRHQTWHGAFDMGERVGVWERRRWDNTIIARGEYPRGTPVEWELTIGEKSIAVEISSADELPQWLSLAEDWLTGRNITLHGWTSDQRRRGTAWIDARLAREPRPEPIDDEPPEETAARRNVSVHATGDTVTGTLIVVGTLELPNRVIADAPQSFDARNVYSFRAGTYELVGSNNNNLAIIRLPGATIAHWRYLGEPDASYYGLLSAGADRTGIEEDADEGPEGAEGPAEWIAFRVLPCGSALVWISNPSGNGIRAYAGVADDGDIVAVFLHLH